MRTHGGQAAQARRRGEEWIQCVDCTPHSPPRRRLMQAEPEPDDRMTPMRLLGLVIFALGMWAVLLFALPVVMIGLFGGQA